MLVSGTGKWAGTVYPNTDRQTFMHKEAHEGNTFPDATAVSQIITFTFQCSGSLHKIAFASKAA